MVWPRVVILIAIAFFAVLCWLGRYEITATSDTTPSAYRLDRWTGEVTLIMGPAILPVKPYSQGK